MIRVPLFLRALVLALLMHLLFGMSMAQGTGETAGLVRAQVRSLGSDMGRASKQKIPVPAMLQLRVEASSGKTLIENALIEGLTGTGYGIRLSGIEQSAAVLHVLVMKQGVQHQELAGAGFERTIRSDLDARLEFDDGSVFVLGSFSAEARDTVLQRDGLFLSDDPTSSFLDKVAGPVFLITGAFLIVYLFFTVRS
jgi:hypothetical protein